MYYINIQTDAITSFVGFSIASTKNSIVKIYRLLVIIVIIIDFKCITRINTYTVSPKVDRLKKKSSAPKSYARVDDPAINAKKTIDESHNKKTNQCNSPQ